MAALRGPSRGARSPVGLAIDPDRLPSTLGLDGVQATVGPPSAHLDGRRAPPRPGPDELVPRRRSRCARRSDVESPRQRCQRDRTADGDGQRAAACARRAGLHRAQPTCSRRRAPWRSRSRSGSSRELAAQPARRRHRACCRGRSRPCGQAARRARGAARVAPGRAASAPSSRNSVGRQRDDGLVAPTASVLDRVEAQRADDDGRVRRRRGARAPASRATSSANCERLGQVIVTAGAEPREPVGDRVARGEEEHRAPDPARAQRLAESRPSASGSPMSRTIERRRRSARRASASRPLRGERRRIPPRRGPRAAGAADRGRPRRPVPACDSPVRCIASSGS